MLFSAVTGTPCLALDNVSHKVRDGYAWIQDLPYILYSDGSDLPGDICRLSEIAGKTWAYDRIFLDAWDEKMKSMIGGTVNGEN